MNLWKFRIGLLILFFESTLINAQNKNSEEINSMVFEPGNVSTAAVEYSFSYSGKEVYFARSTDKWGGEIKKNSIYSSVLENNKWSVPKLVSFSGQYIDSDPHLTDDGKTLYFISKRPLNDNRISADIWMVEKDRTGKWSPAIKLDQPFNSEGNEYSPRTDKNGNLYFASDRSGGYGQGDLYMAKKENGEFTLPTNLGSTINTKNGEWNLEINRDGDLIIFEASQRKQNLSSYGDLYISFKLGDEWTIPQNIKELNTTGSDLYPYLGNNERTLYFTSSDSLKSTNTDIYFTEFETLYNRYKNKSVLPEK